MQIDIDSDIFDQLLGVRLQQDYAMLEKQIEELSVLADPKPYQLEDLKDNLMFKHAMERMLEYYVGYHWKKEAK
jgi:hypothetical protein